MKEKYVLTKDGHEIDRFATIVPALDRLAAIEPDLTIGQCVDAGYQIGSIREYEQRKERQAEYQIELDRQISRLLDLGLGDPGRDVLEAMSLAHLTIMIDELEDAQNRGHLDLETDDGIEELDRIINTYTKD